MQIRLAAGHDSSRPPAAKIARQLKSVRRGGPPPRAPKQLADAPKLPPSKCLPISAVSSRPSETVATHHSGANMTPPRLFSSPLISECRAGYSSFRSPCPDMPSTLTAPVATFHTVSAWFPISCLFLQHQHEQRSRNKQTHFSSATFHQKMSIRNRRGWRVSQSDPLRPRSCAVSNANIRDQFKK
ncbi:hypothetical protein L209DRAFT_313441 [Thermothelomyces heterothallicus CBS 203.75]